MAKNQKPLHKDTVYNWFSRYETDHSAACDKPQHPVQYPQQTVNGNSLYIKPKVGAKATGLFALLRSLRTSI